MDELPSLVEKIPDLAQCASVFRSFANVVIEPNGDGVKGKAERKKEEEVEDDKGKRIIVEEDEDESREGMSADDLMAKQSILDLFEEGWHAKPFAGKRK